MAKKLSPSEAARMRKLYEENGLTPDDVFQHQHYTIITRQGIEKIQAKHNIRVRFDVEHHDPSTNTICLRGYAWHAGTPDDVIETFGEVNPKNNRNAYPWAMAEKRTLSRLVLKAAGLYAEGVFGEDEAEDFAKSNPKRRAAAG